MKQFKSSIRAIFLTALIGVSTFVLATVHPGIIAADTEPPAFPSCSDKIFSSPGDKAHYDSGTHGIVGVGNLVGSDDVYTLGNGNFLQCFCPVDRSTGIQSNWWDAKSLSSDIINVFKSQGWFFQSSGTLWNLLNDPYLVQNMNFSCTPSPSITPTPAQPVPTPTPGPQSSCINLVAEPKEGTAPLTVKFSAAADDPATQGKIKQYRFDFADASGGQPQVWYQTDPIAYHRYQLSGDYTASLKIQDNAGNWRESDSCKEDVKVNAAPSVLGTSTTSELPSTGLPATVAAMIIILPGIGFYLYKHFRLV